MMIKSVVLALVTSTAALGATSAHAGGVAWSIGINTPVVGTVISNQPTYYDPGYRVYAPVPVYAPAPVYAAPVAYYPPAPVVYERYERPVMYRRYEAYEHGYGYVGHRGWRHGHRHWHDGDR
jgi:hypothetical protein